MQRWISVSAGLLAVGLSAYLVSASYKLPVPTPRVDAASDGGSSDAPADAADAGVGDADPSVESDAPLDLSWSNRDGGIGFSLPDGTPVPALPDGAPREVKFGVVLVTYAGAQGVPASGRAKEAAREHASRLAQEAQADFRSVVHRGDSGSSEDVGRVRRGILEPAVEYALFTLPVGGVSALIDTPRGFWIVKRIE